MLKNGIYSIVELGFLVKEPSQLLPVFLLCMALSIYLFTAHSAGLTWGIKTIIAKL